MGVGMTDRQQDHERRNKTELQNGADQSSEKFKIDVCTFWQRGVCNRGKQCTFAHGKEETRPRSPTVGGTKPPTSRITLPSEQAEHKFKTELCKFWNTSTPCKRGNECTYAHDVSELRAPPPDQSAPGKGARRTDQFSSDRPPKKAASPTRNNGELPHKYKTQRCKFFENGKCTRGSECTFAHSDRELLPLADAEGRHGVRVSTPTPYEDRIREPEPEAPPLYQTMPPSYKSRYPPPLPAEYFMPRQPQPVYPAAMPEQPAYGLGHAYGPGPACGRGPAQPPGPPQYVYVTGAPGPAYPEPEYTPPPGAHPLGAVPPVVVPPGMVLSPSPDPAGATPPVGPPMQIVYIVQPPAGPAEKAEKSWLGPGMLQQSGGLPPPQQPQQPMLMQPMPMGPAPYAVQGYPSGPGMCPPPFGTGSIEPQQTALHGMEPSAYVPAEKSPAAMHPAGFYSPLPGQGQQYDFSSSSTAASSADFTC